MKVEQAIVLVLLAVTLAIHRTIDTNFCVKSCPVVFPSNRKRSSSLAVQSAPQAYNIALRRRAEELLVVAAEI
jgi:hypothetical protein